MNEMMKPAVAAGFISRDDKIRTCDPTPPRRVRYRAALHPEIFCKSIFFISLIHKYLLAFY